MMKLRIDNTILCGWLSGLFRSRGRFQTLTGHSLVDISVVRLSFDNPMRGMAAIDDLLGVLHHRFDLKYGRHTNRESFINACFSQDYCSEVFVVSKRP